MLNKYKGMGFREMPGSDVLGTEIVISGFYFIAYREQSGEIWKTRQTKRKTKCNNFFFNKNRYIWIIKILDILFAKSLANNLRKRARILLDLQFKDTPRIPSFFHFIVNPSRKKPFPEPCKRMHKTKLVSQKRNYIGKKFRRRAHWAPYKSAAQSPKSWRSRNSEFGVKKVSFHSLSSPAQRAASVYFINKRAHARALRHTRAAS